MTGFPRAKWRGGPYGSCCSRTPAGVDLNDRRCSRTGADVEDDDGRCSGTAASDQVSARAVPEQQHASVSASRHRFLARPRSPSSANVWGGFRGGLYDALNATREPGRDRPAGHRRPLLARGRALRADDRGERRRDRPGHGRPVPERGEPIDALRSRRGGPDDVLETDPIVVPVTPIKDHPMAPTPGGPLPSPFLPVT